MNKFRFIMAAVAAMFLTAGVYAQDLDALYDKYDEAYDLYEAKQYKEAIAAFEAVIDEGLDMGPDAADIVTGSQKLLPSIYFRLGGTFVSGANLNYDEAIANFEKAAELAELYGDPGVARNAAGWIARAYTAAAAEAFNAKDYARAAEIFAKGYEADPTNTDLGLNLALSYAEMGELEKAFTVYEEIVALGDRHSKYKDAAAEAKNKLTYYQTFDIQAAIEAKDFNKANSLMEAILEADPSNSLVNMMYIQAATNQQNWDRVIARGQAAADAQTTDELKSDAYFLLGAAYQNKDNVPKAIENYRKVTAGNYVNTARQQIAALNK